MRGILPLAVASLAFAGAAVAADNMKAPPAAPFQEVSKLVKLPDFIPGLGTLYVDPSTLPAGPFLAYDHDGKLSATVYMIPWKELSSGTAYDNLAVGAENVTGVDVLYNPGHPGVEEPHAHIILYHDKGAKERLAK